MASKAKPKKLLDRALETKLKQSPDKAFAPLLQALGRQDSRAPEVDLDRAAVSLCRRLRHAGKHALALRLAEAGQQRTRALRTEECLAALGVGDLDRVTKRLASDEVLAGALAPLLAALEGRPVIGDGGPAALQPVVRWLGALDDPSCQLTEMRWAPGGRTAAALGRGETVSVEQATALLGSLPAELHPGVWGQLAQVAPEALLGLAGSLAAPLATRLQALSTLQRRAASDRAAARAWAHWAPRLPSSSLEPALRPWAALAEAFRASDPAVVRRLLAVAEQAAIEPIEVARARLNLAIHSPPGHRSVVPIAEGFEQVATLAEADPDGDALAAVAWFESARIWESLFEDQQGQPADAARLEAAIASARRLAPALRLDAPSLLDELARLDLGVLTREDPLTAIDELEDRLQDHPAEVSTWRLRWQAAQAFSLDQVDDVLQRAIVACHDQEFLREARAVLLERGRLQPFELLPDAPSAGLLAAEFDRALDQDTLDLEDWCAVLDRLAAPLPSERRFALDLATLDALAGVEDVDIHPWFEAAVQRHGSDPLRLMRLISLLLWSHETLVPDELTWLLSSPAPLSDSLLRELLLLCLFLDQPGLARQVAESARWADPRQQRDARSVHQTAQRGWRPPRDHRLDPFEFLPEAESLLDQAYEFDLDEGGELPGLPPAGSLGDAVGPLLQNLAEALLSPAQRRDFARICQHLDLGEQRMLLDRLLATMSLPPARSLQEAKTIVLSVLQAGTP